jgi:L-ascorbate metabolism protein UlaG (beta-lactamase superfamily)
MSRPIAAPDPPRLTYVGGPAALLEWHGLRLLLDPTLRPGRNRTSVGTPASPLTLGSDCRVSHLILLN